jgi:predicted PurR-regulated permease PerM
MTIPTDPSPSGAAPADSPARVLLHMPVDVRSAALGLMALLLSLFALRWAAAVMIPLVLGVLFSHALSPAADLLARARVPRGLAAALLVLGVVAGLGGVSYALADDAAQLVESLPGAAQKLRLLVRERVGRAPGALDQVQAAATELEKAADESASARPEPTAREVMPVRIVEPPFQLQDYFWTGTLGFVALCGQAAVVFLLTYFLLASGNAFRLKLVRIAGPSLSQKKITVQVLDEITHQIQRYLLVQLLISAMVGASTWLVFLALGMEQPAVWGVAAAVLNLVPYVGSVALAAAALLGAVMQTGDLDWALLVAASGLAIRFVSGYLLAPWLTSRASRLSPVAVFGAVLAWGWLWGVWGMLLGVPIVMMVKAVCDRVDGFKPVGELLGA